MGDRAVHAVGEHIGDKLDLKYNQPYERETVADALRLGRDLDASGFY